jgi:hypothetical protein
MQLSWARVASTVLLLVFGALLGGGATWLVIQTDRKPRRRSPPPAIAKAPLANPKPAVQHRLGYHRSALRFRVEDATSHEPIGLARVRVENLNLADELGVDSEAMTAPDGRATIDHRFFAHEEKAGEETVVRVIFQGPWIYVSRVGYRERRMPLSDLVHDLVWGRSPHHFEPFSGHQEVVVGLEPGAANARELAELAGDYTAADACVYVCLTIARDGTYQYSYWNDTGGAGEYLGKCEVVDGALHFKATGPSTSIVKYLSGVCIPVDWGDRTFLVPEQDRLIFCSAANHAFRPNWVSRGPGVFGGPFSKIRLEGIPKVASEWKPYILPKPVTATITELISQELVMLDKGAKEGLRAGMLFVRENDPNSPRYTVLYVDEARCLVKDLDRYDPLLKTLIWRAPLAAGRTMSTASPNWEAK